MVVLVISLGLIFVDHRSQYLSPVRYYLSYAVTPFQYAASVPAALSSWVYDTFTTRESLLEENAKLQARALLLQRRVQKLAALAAENVRLRELLNSSALVAENVTVAEILGVDPDPYRHEIIINKGENDGVFLGLPVLDAQGLMGQVIAVGPHVSRALLISDSSHAIPVQINRNGVRAIAVGGGSLDLLMLTHVPDTADVVEGDILVSSGLGQRFPEGYPVGVVTRVHHDPGESFAIVEAKPSAHLDRSRHVLLVFKEQKPLNWPEIEE